MLVYTSFLDNLNWERAYEGFNCSVFAYGSTGAGKTFTMILGRAKNDQTHWDERALTHMFDKF